MPKIILIACFLFLFNLAALAQIIEQTRTADFSSKPLAILSAPKANYTDSARKKDVDGIVKLQVVFRFDGTIGEITDVTVKKRRKLEKYGLTGQAIAAARKIKFAPATASGQPVTVVKTIEYGFSVY